MLKACLVVIKDPDQLDEVRAYAHYVRGVIFDRAGDTPAAMEEYTRAIDLGTAPAFVYAIRGVNYAIQGELDLAIADFDQAIARDPKSWQAFRSRGMAHGQKGQVDLAIADYTELLRLRPEFAEAHYSRSVHYLQRYENDLALADLNEAIRLAPDMANAFTNRGVVYRRRGEFELAERDLRRAIEIYPQSSPVSRLNLGELYLFMGDAARALEAFDEAIAAQPELAGTFSGRAQALAAIGDEAALTREFDQLIARSDTAAAASPASAVLQNNRCWYRTLANRDLEVARSACDAALAATPDNAGFRDSRGLLNLKQGRFEDAWQDYNVATQQNPYRPTFLYGRGLAALKSGRQAAGEADIAQALERDITVSQTFARYGVTR